ncbi:MAG: di-heme-cytochrome C peroxidase [Gammaproteobacteria bacterium]|nr:di-heme-cytochrome C peroxidase [Gammaproteobacteria bacterium]
MSWLKLSLKVGLSVVVLLGVFLFINSEIRERYAFWDDDPDRGAVAMNDERFDENFSKPTYLSQGWNASQSLWFYSATQGSDMIPYDFFMALEQYDSPRWFRDAANMNRYRYLPQKRSFSNPDALPVGFVKDVYQGKEYMGFTCAACHTSQINYQGEAIRIDGGASMADMNQFMVDLGRALQATAKDEAKKTRFIKQVLARNGVTRMISGGRDYSSATEVEADLLTYISRINSYNTINHPGSTQYGYARLDAFGRIYNRVLEHVLMRKDIKFALQEVLDDEQVEEVLGELDAGLVQNGEFDHLLAKLDVLLQAKKIRRADIVKLRDLLFIKANAPVSYPFLWDIAQSDYVQWNGIGDNGTLGPLGRNSGEVVGVFGTLDWQKKPGFSISSLILGDGKDRSHISYRSSLDKRNLRLIESQLAQLQSPQWPEKILGKIDQQRAAKGEVLYEKHCLSCHARIDRADPDRRVIANFTKLEAIGTDPQMASNASTYTGRSGIVGGLTQSTPVGKLYLQDEAAVASILTLATTGVVSTPDPDLWAPTRFAEWVYTLATAFFSNDVVSTIKRGDYNPDTTVEPFASLKAYKGRPLNGIWATAPYLHNGSVPTLYDLLLPVKALDDWDEEIRPTRFSVVYREFDPRKVGFVNRPFSDRALMFETHKKGNSNAGHEYATAELSREERLDVVEYLKTL